MKRSVDGKRKEFLKQGMPDLFSLDSGLIHRNENVAKRRKPARRSFSRLLTVGKCDDIRIPIVMEEIFVDPPDLAVRHENDAEFAQPIRLRAKSLPASAAKEAGLAAGWRQKPWSPDNDGH